jgi:hypothetical protein
MDILPLDLTKTAAILPGQVLATFKNAKNLEKLKETILLHRKALFAVALIVCGERINVVVYLGTTGKAKKGMV